MSALGQHRCRIFRPAPEDNDGIAEYTYSEPFTASYADANGLKCRLDTNMLLIKDAEWDLESGRAPDRLGILFIVGSVAVRAEDIVVMTVGDDGVFHVVTPPDRASNYGPTTHHLEVQVRENVSGLSPASLLG